MSERLEKRPYLLRILGTWGVFLLVAVLLSVRLGPVPPLGEFLSPRTGYLRNELSPAKGKKPNQLKVAGLRSAINISIDTRGVPHVVADNDLDLAFGQGFATARDRLWQMELQTAATAGRVSEILGAKAINFDIEQRRFGFLAAAEAEIDFLKKNDPSQHEILVAYAEGVNTYIQSLTPATYPIEYKLLGSQPEPWTPLKSALFHKQMTWTLTGSLDDFKFTNTLQKFSMAEIENLFPEFYSAGEPILDKNVVQMSTAELQGFSSAAAPLQLDGLLNLSDAPRSKKSSTSGTHGSNNWVVDGTHTTHGYPVLANDPHLDLKLPSIWYEIQLTAPGVNVYGVSLPGLPHVIIGFNENVSWGITNAGVDVLDWFAMKFDKSKPAPRYLHGGQWKTSQIRKETIKVKGELPRLIDVVQTHIGPVAVELELEKKNGGTSTLPLAMKWTGHSPSNEFKVFHNLNRARTVREMKNALRSYEAPGQNFVLSDKTGSIGYIQAGRYPLRKPNHGRFVLDGTVAAGEWNEFIPFTHLPQSWSPERGFLATANQQPTRNQPIGYASGDWGFTSYLRGTRIHESIAGLLEKSPLTIGALMQLQNDVLDLRAKNLLPLFLNWTAEQKRSANEEKAFQLLKNWNYELSSNSVAAAIWSIWWDVFHDSVWEKAFPQTHFRSPSEDRTMELLLESSTGEWPDIHNVPKFSVLPQLAATTFSRTIETLQLFNRKKGSASEYPAWGELRGTSIPHLANLSGFGLEKLPTGGSGNTVNALTEKHGPSWRMVVTWVDAQTKAWGIYPGGQSGHVGSDLYANMKDQWLKGELDELFFVQQGTLKETLTRERIVLEKKQ
ncbi:MAG: penicillin acylase family protein [Betaproteobacteria bacterium]|nr:penicillin acylase family protein [Betaproteobacteria bacterium]